MTEESVVIHDPREVDPGSEAPLAPEPPPRVHPGDPESERLADPRIGEVDDPLEDGADDYDA